MLGPMFLSMAALGAMETLYLAILPRQSGSLIAPLPQDSPGSPDSGNSSSYKKCPAQLSVPVLVRVRGAGGEREGEKDRKTGIYFNELVYVFVEVRVQNLQASSWRPREEPQSDSKGHLLAECLSRLGRSVFVLLRPAADWVRPACVTEGTLLRSKHTDLNVSLVQNTHSQKHPE